MHHQQLATRMVCSWKLVKAYQQTRQSTYVCPPAPHVIEAFNHKVNHDSHKELGTQEHAVLQYAHALQYVSYCNDERYKDHLALAVKAFWDEGHPTVQQQGSPKLRPVTHCGQINASTSCGKKSRTMECGTTSHWFVGPFFRMVEGRSQYEARQCRWEEERGHTGASGGHRSPSHGPERAREWDRKPLTPKASRARSKPPQL